MMDSNGLNQEMINSYYEEGKLKIPQICVFGKMFNQSHIPVGDLDNPSALLENKVDIYQYIVHFNLIKLINLLVNVLPSDGFGIVSIPNQDRPHKLKRCLVIGCDTGHEFPLLENYFEEVCGIELSKEHVERAHETFNRDNIIHADAGLSLPYSDGYFDIVIGIHVFEHIPNPYRLLKQLNRILVVGGKVCHVTPHIELRNGDPEPAHVTKLNKQEWIKLYKKASFAVSTSYFAWSLNCDELHIIARKEGNKNGRKIFGALRRWFG